MTHLDNECDGAPSKVGCGCILFFILLEAFLIGCFCAWLYKILSSL